MASSVIRFFKIVVTKSLQDGTLKVPKKFSKNYGDGVLNPVYLKPPDGTQWKIDWTNHDGEILFERGWKEFAAYYSLGHGHMLWFEYNGTSNIEIHILEMSGIEIDYPSNDHISGDNSVGISKEQSPPKEKAKEAPEPSSPRRSKRLKRTVKTSDVERSLSNEEDSQSEETQSPSNEEDSQSEEAQPEMLRKRSKKPYVKDFYPGTPGFHALKEAEKFKSENPSFIVKTSRATISRQAASIQASFFRKYFKKEQQNIQIRFERESMPAKVCSYGDGSAAVISAGWSYFAQTSKLQPGDVAVFELINREDPVLKVHVYRAHDYSSSNDNSVGSSKKEQRQEKKEKAAPKPSSPSRSKRLKHTIQTTDVEGSPDTQNLKQNVNDEEDSQSEEKQIKMLIKRFRRPYVDAFSPGSNGFLALNEAQKFNSENPSFIVKATQANISGSTANFQASFFRNYFKKKDQNIQIRFERELFPAKLCYYQHHSLAIISAGWRLFARRSKLQPGDVTVFELINREDPLFDAHIYRAQEQASDLRTGGFQHLKEAQKFRSDNPFFMVKMMQYNLSKSRTTIPNSFFMKYFKKEEPNVKIRFENKLFPAKLLCYPLLTKAYITTGWQPFANASNLKAGDVCIFELFEVKDRVLDVHIYRAAG